MRQSLVLLVAIFTFRVKVDADAEVDSWTVFFVSSSSSVAAVTVRCTGYFGITGRLLQDLSRFSGMLRSTVLTLASVCGAVDVSVILHVEFQQSFVEFYLVPQLQFIDRVVFFSVASQRQGLQCKLCKTGDSTVQFYAKVLTWPCCACRDGAENCGHPAVAGIDMVVDVPVVRFVLVGCPVPGQSS